MWISVFLLVIGSLAARAQVPNVTDTTSTPVPGMGHNYIHLLDATVNPANGSLSIRLNIPLPKGRGLNLPFAIAYDSNSLFHVTNDQLFGYGPAISYSHSTYPYVSTDPYAQSGWSYTVPRMTLTKIQISNGYPLQGTHYWSCDWNTDYMFFDPQGGGHALHLGLEQSSDSEDPNGSPNCPTFTYEGTGGHLYARSAGDRTVGPTVTTADNTIYSFPPDGLPAFNGVTSNGPPVYDTLLPTTVEDRNGNIIAISKSGSGFTYTDTLQRQELSVSSFGTSDDSIAVSGLAQPFVASWTTKTAQGFSLTFTPVSGSDSQCSTFTLGPIPQPGSSLTENVISTLTLPDGKEYTFSYDPVYGLLDQITYPGGGWVKYDWGVLPQYEQGTYYWEQPPPPQGYPTPPPVTDPISPAPLSYYCKETYDWVGITHRYVSFDGTNIALQQDFTYSYSPSTATKTTTVVTTDLTSSKSYTTIYTYAMITDEMNDPYVPSNFGPESQFVTLSPQEKTITYKDVNNAVLKGVTKTWYDPYLLESEATTVGSNGPTSKTVYSYTPSGQISEMDNYGFGASSPTRKTITQYASFGSTHILDRPSSVVVENGSGSIVAESDYAYDQAAVTSATATSHDETNYGSNSTTPRGNVTTVTRGGSTITYTYDEAGQVKSMTDACGHAACPDMSGSSHTTTYSYTDHFLNGDPPGATDAYVTKITDPAGHTTQFKWGYAEGRMWYKIDENNQTTQFCYVTGGCGGSSFDPFYRLTGVAYPDGGKKKITYSDAGPEPSMTVRAKQEGSVWLLTTTTYDGMGHVIEVKEPNWAKIDTTYDGMGHIQSVTNPHYSATDPLYGTTTYTYDALGRKTIQVQPDGSKLQWCYDDMKDEGQANCSSEIGSAAPGQWVDFTDEAGNHWQRTYDALGRLTEVIEDASHSKLETDYAYDALGNLLRVDQWGGAHGGTGDRVRTFTYDSLSRLLCASNPENSSAQCPATAGSYTAGTTGYSYDANGNVSAKLSPLPNQTGSATLTTTNTYDELNRLTGVSYSDGVTPGDFYVYDVAPSWAPNLQNVVGRVAYSGNSYAGGTSGYATETAYSYDPMGRVVQKWEQTPSTSPNGYTVSAIYDLAGHLTSATTAAGTTLTYNHDVDGRVSTITSSLDDAQHPGTLYSVDPSVGYYSSGAIHKATFGNGLTETEAFNNRLQPCRMNLNSSGSYYSHCAGASPQGTVLDFTMGYNAGSVDNGNVVSWAATGEQVFDRSYGYDRLNRLASMTDTASGESCKGLAWTVDAWGNVTSQTVTGGSCYSFSTSAGAKNQLTLDTYDAAGNVTYDGTHHYTYDALGHVLSVDNGAARYVYNENGQRVRKTTGGGFTEYFYGVNGKVQSEWDGSSWPNQYVYDGSRLLAIYPAGTTEFVRPDFLGSTRLVTGVSGNIVDSMGYEPYGQQIAGNSATSHKFTGKVRDAESGNDYFNARYYASATGRFLSPDPLMATPERLLDPQEWNMYAYAVNNPLSVTDPTGLDIWLQGCGTTNTATCRNNYVGTTDANGNFTRTHLSGDQTGDASLGENGISVTQGVNTYQGVWDTNPNEQAAVLVSGAGDLSSFNANITGACQNTCVASGVLENKNGTPAIAQDLRNALQGKSAWFANNADFFHRHDGKNDTSFNANPPGPPGQRSTDVTVPRLGTSLDSAFHVNSGYPFQDAYQMTRHVISIMHTFTNTVGITHPTTQ